MPYKNEDLITYVIGISSFFTLDAKNSSVSTDHVSNAVILDNDDALEWLRFNSNSPLRISEKTLRLILHEATHNAVFISRVCASLSALWISIAGRALLTVAEGRNGELSLQERDFLVAHWMFNVFEPLFEGTALFAEHDTNANDFDQSTNAIYHLFALNVDFSIKHNSPQGFLDDNNERLIARVSEARRSDYWIEHKATLLSEPICVDDEGSAYLLGYLAVKRMYLDLFERSGSPLEPDIFLYCCINHWFSDKELSSLLLTAADKHAIAVQSTIGNIAERIQDIAEDRYQIVCPANWNPYSESTDSDRSMELDEILYGLRTASDSLNFFTPKLLKHRNYLRLGFVRVKIECPPGSKEVSVYLRGSDQLLFSCPKIKDINEFEMIPAVLEFVRSDKGTHFVCVCVIAEFGIVAVRDINKGDWNPGSLVEEFSDFPSIEQVEAAANEAQNNPKAYGWDREGYAETREHALAQSLRLRDHMFQQIAFSKLEVEQRSKLIERLSKRGFRDVLDSNEELLELAELSLLFGGRGATLEGDEEERNVSELMNRVEYFNSKLFDELQFTPFEIFNGRIVSVI